ncbi:MAG: hypothetical protein AAFO99_14670, partial [Bacteroidota bacterium]
SKLDPFVIIKPCLVLAAITLYRPLVKLLVIDPMQLIDSIVLESIEKAWGAGGTATGLIGWYENAFYTLYIDSMTFVYPGSSPGLGVYDIIAINPALEVIHLLIYFAANVVGFYILGRQVILASIYYVLGVLAVPFSLIVGNQSVLGSWFFGFISVMLWEPILRIMKAIIVAMDVTNLSFTNAILSLGLQVVMIITILQVPKFANTLVSKGSELGSGIGDTITQRLTGGR